MGTDSLWNNKEFRTLRTKCGNKKMVFMRNSETKHGEPKIHILLSDGTSLDIIHKFYGLPLRDWYYSMYRNCPDSGIMETFVYADWEELEKGFGIFMDVLYQKGVYAVFGNGRQNAE